MQKVIPNKTKGGKNWVLPTLQRLTCKVAPQRCPAVTVCQTTVSTTQ